ncbi:MAG: LPP20 family lipoprotein [Campylobacterales bacterium]|nr:LPP20 family lipoprotein [Campylobacterales bacterium]
MKRPVLLYQNFHSKNLALAVFTASLLTGCVNIPTISPAKKELTLPNWYVQSPSNSELYLYGEGSGSTLEQAQQNALNNMASRLQVTVQSSIQSNTTSQTSFQLGSNYSKTISQDLKIDVAKIKFSQYTIENSIQIGNNFYVLAKVNRTEFYQLKHNELLSQDHFINGKIKILENLGLMEKINLLQSLLAKLEDAKRLSVLIHILNNQFNHIPYVSKYDELINMIEIIQANATMSVESNNEKGYFKDVLIDMLNQSHFNIASKSDIKLQLNPKIKYSLYNGWHIAKVSLTLNIISENKVISSKVFSVTGRSSTSQESALESASLQFRKQLEDQTLHGIIFTK